MTDETYFSYFKQNRITPINPARPLPGAIHGGYLLDKYPQVQYMQYNQVFIGYIFCQEFKMAVMRRHCQHHSEART